MKGDIVFLRHIASFCTYEVLTVAQGFAVIRATPQHTMVLRLDPSEDDSWKGPPVPKPLGVLKLYLIAEDFWH